MLCNQPEEVHLTQLPKTFLTRKGAIVLYTSLNQAKQNCEQNIYNDVGCPEINKVIYVINKIKKCSYIIVLTLQPTEAK